MEKKQTVEKKQMKQKQMEESPGKKKIYVRPISYRCYVSTFRTICDKFAEIIPLEIEDKLKRLNIYQYLQFPAFEQNAPLIYQLMTMWDISKECFMIKGQVIPFSVDEVALLTGLPNREFNNVSTKISNNKPAGYISGFVPLLIVWFLEHTSIHSPMYPDKRPRFLRWPDDIVYNTKKTTKLFVNLKKRQHYKQKDQNSKLFIDHINSNSVKSSKILLHPIIDGSHWTLIVGFLNEEKWEFYDSVPNPIHKNIAQKIIRSLYRDLKKAFPNDIRKWKFKSMKGAPTQTNNVDCGMFVCKYMENIILQNNTNWTESNDWQANMPKYRAEFPYALLCASLK
ncbi:hypothetical protein IEQ34_009241 [Dendrobium chrysotoxum]|uniref:Ubiquitin-like protease family profile domain-containing protein n=1 Tax=Dendrobium chrysotoxum TaxID=161865 RepID=A0AAV7GY51_DENCH|nr:hypothetical protein IEQ34_009241 [Dendrobium chrysotoxum]